MRGRDHRNLYEDPVAALTPQYELVVVVMACVSHSLLVFLRQSIGYRLLQPWVFCLLFVVLFGLGYHGATAPSGTEASHQGGQALAAFAVMMILLAGIHRYRAWSNTVHSMGRGHSLIAPLFRLVFLPEWFVQRWIEPLLILALGAYLILRMHWGLLGWWLAVAAACLAGIEDIVLKNERDARLDLRDSRIEGGMLAAWDGQGKERNGRGKERPLAQGRRGKGKGGGAKVATLAPELARLRPGQETVTRRRGDRT